MGIHCLWQRCLPTKKMVFTGGCGGERVEEDKRGERRGRSGAVTEDRSSHSKKINIK